MTPKSTMPLNTIKIFCYDKKNWIGKRKKFKLHRNCNNIRKQGPLGPQ